MVRVVQKRGLCVLHSVPFGGRWGGNFVVFWAAADPIGQFLCYRKFAEVLRGEVRIFRAAWGAAVRFSRALGVMTASARIRTAGGVRHGGRCSNPCCGRRADQPPPSIVSTWPVMKAARAFT